MGYTFKSLCIRNFKYITNNKPLKFDFMKVLLVGLERVGKLFSMESLFKKKLTEADMTDVEVVTAEMAEFGSPGGRKLERSMNEALRDEADFVVVMEPWQKDLLTRFMDYRNSFVCRYLQTQV